MVFRPRRGCLTMMYGIGSSYALATMSSSAGMVALVHNVFVDAVASNNLSLRYPSVHHNVAIDIRMAVP